ncbi:MAG: 3'-5' exonuclease [Planctomycetaceae bacterium]
MVRLEENFRSTEAILRSADQLIANNTRRKAKRLYSALGEGEPVRLWNWPTAEHEADAIARQIKEAIDAGKRRADDFAIFYRVNALSRLLELALMRHRVPFQVAAGFAFYDRAEVKDLLAYLRLVENPRDRAAFLRVVNTPLRGLGKTSQDRLTRWADTEGLTCLEAAARAKEVPRLSKKAVVAFQRFGSLIESLSLADTGSVAALLEKIIDKTYFLRSLGGSDPEKEQAKIENVGELVNAARAYDRAAGDDITLEGFLEQTSLVSDLDAIDNSAGEVTLMTLHAAKGLEFPVVWIIGLEQGLLPHERSIGADADGRELEEERRLLFVGLTRARQELNLSHATRRMMRGQERLTIPSPFLNEIETRSMQSADDDASTEWGAFDFDDHAQVDSSHSGSAAGENQPAKSSAAAESADLRFLRSKLTTGAALLNGTNASVDMPSGFALGSRVRHPRYGMGVVTNVSGFGPRRTVTVRFQEDAREQSFIAAQSPLQPVGG